MGELSVFSAETGEFLWQKDATPIQGETPEFTPDSRYLLVAGIGSTWVYERLDEEGRRWTKRGAFALELPAFGDEDKGGFSKSTTYRGLEFDPSGRLLWITFGKEGGKGGDGVLGGIALLSWARARAKLAGVAPGEEDRVLRLAPLSAYTGLDHDPDRIHLSPSRRFFAIATWEGRVHVIEGDGHFEGLDLDSLLSLQLD
tara:strand:- start:349 stop:948 length:600 start_codon:yes stop_codon:yes gene_type:complete